MNFKNFIVEAAEKAKAPPVAKKMTKDDRRKALCKKYNKGNMSPMDDTVKSVNISTIQKHVNKFVDKHPGFSKALYFIVGGDGYPQGLGPGEIICDFIFDDIVLGGGSESTDLKKGGSPFAEVKAGVYVGKHGYINNFKFGTEGATAYLDLVHDLKAFVTYYNDNIDSDSPIKIDKDKYSEINGIMINVLKGIGDINDSGHARPDFPKKGIPLTLDKEGDVKIKSVNIPFTNIDKESLPADMKQVYNDASSTNLNPFDEEISSFEKIEQKWKNKILSTDLATKPFIFFDNKKQNGSIIYVGHLTDENLGLERITANTAKPFIRVKGI